MVAKRLKGLIYPIREITIKARELEKQGKSILYFTAGDPLKHGFDVFDDLKHYLCEVIKQNNSYYGNPVGEESTRNAIALREKRFNGINIDPENIVIGNGLSEVFLIISTSLFEPGDEVLVPGPTYPMYDVFPRIFGAKPVDYLCSCDLDWHPDVEDIEKKITEKTKAIVIINPNNPTGLVYNEKIIKRIVEIAAQHNLLVFSDEIYDHNVLEGEFKSTAAIVKDYPIIGLNGISKAYLATGWRLGYVYIANPNEKALEFMEGVKQMAKIRAYTNTPIQKAAERFMLIEHEKKHLFDKLRKELRKRRDVLIKHLDELGLEYIKPKGAFYAFPKIPKRYKKDDKKFVMDLLHKEGVAFVYGSGFGQYGTGHFRTVFLPPIEKIEEGMRRLKKFLY